MTPEENRDLDLVSEAQIAELQEITVHSYPIEDRQVPASESSLIAVVRTIQDELQSGSNVFVHCLQGIGRAGLVSASLLLEGGLSVHEALERVSIARGIEVPETVEQRTWIERFATIFIPSL